MNEETTLILIDTAIASGSASALDPEERKLQELALALRDDAASPDPDFALRMNARVAAGFPRKRARVEGDGRIRALFAMRPRMAAMGAAASLLVALVVAVSIGTGDHGSSTAPIPAIGAGSSSSASGGGASTGSDELTAPEAQRVPAAPAAKAAPNVSSDSAATSAPAPVPPTNGFVGGSSRKVERSASLVLAPATDKLSEVGDQVVAVTDRYHGIVMRSSVTSAAGAVGGGSFDLRIPVRNLRPALRDLSALADVQSRTENADDVTASFAGANTRLEELRAERRGLLKRLANAGTDQQTAALRARIRFVNAQIQSQMTELQALRRRTAYASVSVALQPKESGSGGGTGIGRGARDLRDSLVDAANIALRVLGVALPIGLVLALLWAGGGWFTRRRREAVLD